MNATPASVERVQKYVFNFEIYRFMKKAVNLPHPPLVVHLQSGESVGRGCQIHPAITYEVVARNRHVARIWPRGGGGGRRPPGPRQPLPKTKKSAD